MGIKKRVSALLLAVSLSFGVCATDYLEVQALEWAGVTIGLDTAIKFLLGLVGVSVGVGVADSIDWTETRENCIQFQENQGNSAVAVSNWWADVISGKLDTASDCWTSFKEWVKNDLLSGSSSVSGSYSDVYLSDIYATINSTLGTNISVGSQNPYFTHCIVVVRTNTSGLLDSIQVFGSSDVTISHDTTSITFSFPSQVDFYYKWGINNNNYSGNLSHTTSSGNNFTCKNFYVYFGGISVPDFTIANSSFFALSSAVATDSDFEAAYDNVTDIGLGSSIASDLPQEGVLDIPWENVGDTAESVDGAIDNALENVNSGTWSLDQYWEYVQNLTNVYAYDITNNYLLPNDGNNETTEDKVQENVNRGAFVLAGLEKVFPFCIPWDIYAFLTLLVAEPVAPVIEYPIYNPVTDTEEIITIDFSVWEQQVIIMRYIFDFLLIIGLLLLARSLIGAGGSD